MLYVEFACLPAAFDAPKAFKLGPAQRVQPLMPRRVLDKPGLVTEPVVAVLSHAMKVGLVLAIVATSEPAVLVEPEPHVPLGDGFVFEHPNVPLSHAHLLVRNLVVKEG